MYTMKEPSVAIIIINFKKADYTIDCLKSILNISYNNFKIFLLDNGSDGELKTKIRTEFNKNNRIVFLESKKNLGFAGGVNFVVKSIKKLNYTYLCLLNNDTCVDKNFLLELVKSSTLSGEENIYFPTILFWQSNIIQSAGLKDYIPRIGQFYKKNSKYTSSLKTESFPYLSCCCILIKIKTFLELEGFNEKYFMYCEDIDLSMRAKKMGLKFFLTPKSKIWHGGAFSFSPSATYYTTKNTLQIIKKYFPKKITEYLRFTFWFSLIFIFYLSKRKYEVSFAILKGTRDFIKESFSKN